MLQEPTAPSGLFADALSAPIQALRPTPVVEPTRALFLGDPGPLHRAVENALGAFRDVKLAGCFRLATELTRWLESDGNGWDLAFVDFAARSTIAPQFVQALLAHAGERARIAVFGDPEWPAMVGACNGIGVHHVLKRGDMASLQSFLEAQGAVRLLS